MTYRGHLRLVIEALRSRLFGDAIEHLKGARERALLTPSKASRRKAINLVDRALVWSRVAQLREELSR